MNAERRKQLAKALDLLNDAAEKAKPMIEEARDIVSEIAEQERGAFDNMPEGLQQSERGGQTETNADTLEAQLEEIDDIMERLDSTIGELEAVN